MTRAARLPWRKKLAFALAPAALLWLLLEFTLALWSPPWLVFENHVPLVYERHERWGYRYAPGASDRFVRYGEIDHAVSIGPHGWRGDAPEQPKPSNRFRVVLLGDSHVAGLEVEARDTLGAALERHLQEGSHGKEEIDVVPLGLDGSGTDVQARILREEGLAYGPDLVLLQIFRNDFRDVGRPLAYREPHGAFLLGYQTEEERGRLVREAERRQRSVLRAAARYSRLARAVRAGWLGKTPDNFLTSGSWFEARETWEPLPERVAMVQEAILEMRRLARSRGAAFAVVSVPASWVLEKNRDPAKPSYPIALLGDWLERERIPYLDLRSALLADGEDPARYFHRLDSHPNGAGYDRMAGEAARWLLGTGLVAQDGRIRDD